MDNANINQLWVKMDAARKKWADAAAEFDRAIKLFADLEGTSDGTLLLQKARTSHARALSEYMAALKFYTEAVKNHSKDGASG